jgi:hypothetical protein
MKLDYVSITLSFQFLDVCKTTSALTLWQFNTFFQLWWHLFRPISSHTSCIMIVTSGKETPVDARGFVGIMIQTP